MSGSLMLKDKGDEREVWVIDQIGGKRVRKMLGRVPASDAKTMKESILALVQGYIQDKRA